MFTPTHFPQLIDRYVALLVRMVLRFVWPYAIFLLPLNCNNNFLAFAIKRFSTFQWRFRCQIVYKLLDFLWFLIATTFPAYSIDVRRINVSIQHPFLGICSNPKCRLNTQDTICVRVYILLQMYECSRSDNIQNRLRRLFSPSHSFDGWALRVALFLFYLVFIFSVSFLCVCVLVCLSRVHATINLFNHIYSLAVKYFKSCWIRHHVFSEG